MYSVHAYIMIFSGQKHWKLNGDRTF